MDFPLSTRVVRKANIRKYNADPPPELLTTKEKYTCHCPRYIALPTIQNCLFFLLPVQQWMIKLPQRPSFSPFSFSYLAFSFY